MFVPMPLTVMITGHRPHLLGGYNENNPKKLAIEKKLRGILTRINTTAIEKGKQPIVISGMALGVDQWWAKAAIDQGIACHAYIPFKGQEARWPKPSQAEYRNLLTHCEKKIIVCPGGYAAWKMKTRNEAMVNNANVCVAIWNGNFKSGTGHCVAYISEAKKPCLIVDPATLEARWELNS